MNDVTELLSSLGEGDPNAASRLLPLVYDELRRLAAQKLACEPPEQTLQPTALVHEAYLRLVGAGTEPEWDNRGHFFAAAAEAMRRILIDNARRKRSLKRGRGLQRHLLDAVQPAAPEPCERLLAIDEALHRFAEVDPAKAELIKLRFFGGCTSEHAARLLGISPATAERWWAYARAWLHQEITRDTDLPLVDRKKSGAG
jgi:RNA polymerase sigma factor (TIGR02999 family)